MGLGLHGGGVATTKWLLKHGATVTATDKRDKNTLASSLASLRSTPVHYVLGEHHLKDFRTHDLVVVNPGVPHGSQYVEAATKAKKRIENDASLFFRYITNPVIAVTGTRGKTTTTLWIAELLKKKYPKVLPSGNTPDNALLKEFDRINGKNIPAVVELSSWQLEYLPASGKAPHIALITNLYPDHLNRYANITEYASAKANIFHLQHDDDFLVLNHENAWTKFFLQKKPHGILFFISTKPLPKKLNGLFVRGDKLIFRFDGIEQQLFSIKKFVIEKGSHNLENLLNAILAVKLYDPTVVFSETLALKLPTARMRQEIIKKSDNLTVVNDSCATSPDGTIAAIQRFQKKGNTVLITGGTDKELEFTELAKVIKKYIQPGQLILLEGTATRKLQNALHRLKMSRSDLDIQVLKTLDSCVSEACAIAQKLKGKTTILFSPGAASFEKFLHEFDRGEQFNKWVKKYAK
jgi:UDP-N-acetylmuramoylalanine--D-glutamate ligase